MKLRKISYILSATLVLSSLTGVGAYATTLDNNSVSTFGIIGDSVVIDKGETGGGSTLLPDNVLEDMSKQEGNLGTWGGEEGEKETTSKDTPIPVKKGSIKIKLPDAGEKTKKGNVKFSLSKVADVKDGQYVMTEGYKSADIDLNTLENANDLEIAANMLKKVATTDSTLTTDENGMASVKDLDVGVYLLYASDIAEYENITPFIISIPVWNDADKTMSFDVEVIPKHTPLPVKEPESSTAPATGFSGGSMFGLLSGISLLGGSSLLICKKKKKSS